MFNNKNFKDNVYQKASSKQIQNDEFYQRDICFKTHSRFSKIRNIAAVILVGALIGTGGYAGYQAIKKGPNYNWLGDSIKFNDDYENYSIEINEKFAESPNGSTLTLKSINYDGGYAVFEMIFKASQEDKEYLELGEKIFTEEEIEQSKAQEIGFFADRMNSYDETLGISEEEYVEKYQKKIDAINQSYEITKELRHSFEFMNAGIVTGLRAEQNVEQVSENEYKIDYYYFITDEEFDDKGQFTMVINNVRLMQTFDRKTFDTTKLSGTSVVVGNDPIDQIKTINLTGNFEYTLSKKDDVKIIKPDLEGMEFDILRQYVDEIKVTPMQTIIKVKSNLTGIKTHTLSTSINEWDDPEFIGMLNFNVYDENMNAIEKMKVQAIRKVIFEDGHVEIWDEYQAGPKPDQTLPLEQNMEVIDYVVISNTDYHGKFYIYPTRQQMYENQGKSYDAELGIGYIIDLDTGITERKTEEVQDFEHIASENDIPKEEINYLVLTGIIEEISGKYEILVEDISPDNGVLFGKVHVPMNDNMKIIKDGKKSDKSALEVGQKVKIIFNFEIEEAYPNFYGVANEIEILEE